MCNTVPAHFRDMHKTVLMQSDIHKGSKIHHIADNSLQLITDMQILKLQHIAS